MNGKCPEYLKRIELTRRRGFPKVNVHQRMPGNNRCQLNNLSYLNPLTLHLMEGGLNHHLRARNMHP